LGGRHQHHNLNGLFCVTKPALDDMIERGWGRIVNISSVNGQKGEVGQTNYAAAKAGIHGFTMSLAREVAHRSLKRFSRAGTWVPATTRDRSQAPECGSTLYGCIG
jgi:NAD(P)-dependent dehydrogenase (short-subunit alcohol dehydrogenase family)